MRRTRGGGRLGRLAAAGALVLAVIAVGWMILSSGDDGNRYRLVFETGGQLVDGNEVLIGGSPVGSVKSVELRDDGQAEVDISVDRALHEGTTAVIRSTSLSGVANRYVSLTPGPNNAPELDENALITEVDTTTPVDLDQLFAALDADTRKGLSDVIQGSATVYTGRAEEANEAYRYFSPALVATDRLFQELTLDQALLSDFLVSGGRVMNGLAERRDDISGFVSNGNQALGAIAVRNRELSRALRALPPTLRQANTTLFNLRPALDDLDEFVNVAKPTTKRLPVLLDRLNPVLGKAVPVFKNLRLAVNRKGKANDLTDATADLPALQKRIDAAVEPAVSAMADSENDLAFYRGYVPELAAGVGKLGQATAYYDGNGHYARVEAAGLSTFRLTPTAPNTFDLLPIADSEVFADYTPGTLLKLFRRCPGGATQPIADSNPFSSPPFTGAPTTPAPGGDCVATDVPPGP